MRRLVYILLMLVVAGAFSCRRGERVAEERLVAIDSLIATAPDSALALLDGIRGDSLPQPLQAYRDLLVSQAMYKAYIPASSDTLIARAWDFYREHGPYDRRIRALLYSGTVAEELGRPDSAMRWYKRTELESHSDDHYHRGYALMSMAYLYQFQYISPNKAISYFRIAKNEFEIANDMYYQLVCMTQLGMIYRIVDTDSARFFSFSALKISESLNDTINYYRNIESIAGSYYKDNDWRNTLSYALKGIKSSLPNTRIPCYYFAAQAQIYLGAVDSARALIAECQAPVTTRDSVLYYRTISILDSVEHNFRRSAENSEMAGRTASAAINRQLQYNYEVEERQPTYENLEQSNRELSLQVFVQYALTLMLLVFLGILVINLFTAHRRIKTEKRAFLTIQEELKQLQQKTKELTPTQSFSSDHHDATLNMQTELQAYCIREMFQSVVYSGIRGTSIFKIIFSMEAAKNTSLISIKLPNDFWAKLNQYIITTFPNAFENMTLRGINLSEKEKQIISLDCLNIPNAVIEKVLGYKERSLAPIRSKLLIRIGNGETDIIKLMSKYSSRKS